jgi:hypothetical protein
VVWVLLYPKFYVRNGFQNCFWGFKICLLVSWNVSKSRRRQCFRDSLLSILLLFVRNFWFLLDLHQTHALTYVFKPFNPVFYSECFGVCCFGISDSSVFFGFRFFLGFFLRQFPKIARLGSKGCLFWLRGARFTLDLVLMEVLFLNILRLQNSLSSDF